MDFILDNLWLVSLIAAVIALVFVALQAKKVLAEDEGTDLMKRISVDPVIHVISPVRRDRRAVDQPAG